MDKRYMAYDGEGHEVGYLTMSEARSRYETADLDEGTATITVGEPYIPATIDERGNGFPDAGDYIAGDDGELYEIVSMEGSIQTGGGPGCGNWIRATLRPADWDDVPAGWQSTGRAIL